MRAAQSGLALLVAQRPPSLRLAVVTNVAAAGFICRGVGFGRRLFVADFTVMDIMSDKITISIFLWRPPQPIEEVDTMQPALVYEVPRKS